MLSATILPLLTLSFLSSVYADRALSITLSGSTEVRDVDNFAVVTTVTNTGSETVELYNTPASVLNNFPTDTFTVTNEDGDEVPFIGAYVKWGFEIAKDFITLAPGESHEVTHQLGDAYNFTMQANYTITPRSTFYAVPSDRDSSPVTIVASMPETNHTTNLSGSLVSSVVTKRSLKHAQFLQKRLLGKRISFNGCTPDQQAAINKAASNAAEITKNTVAYLSRFPNTQRYRMWFGTYSSANRNIVFDHFKKILSSDVTSYQYDCTCDKSIYAEVYRDNFGVVYLCQAFWPAPALGTNSKAGTLIHEASHFNANGGTTDTDGTYGHEKCAQLAIDNPGLAIMNADSHEYYAENTPSLT